MRLFHQSGNLSLLTFFLLCMPFIGLGQNRVIKAGIDYSLPAQEIEGFGASDAWTCRFIGLWPDEQKNKVADLLFSRKLDDKGNPVGIGLNFWRFAIGGGSAEQGNVSGIRDEWRRQASFLKTNGDYDENAMPGQIWFMKAAKSRGAEKFLGFVNSPHVNFTLNNKAFSSDGKTNLNPEKLDAFSNDLLKNVEIIKAKTGIELDYLSPVNEPQWKWNEGNQEGCPYTNLEISQVIKSLSKTLSKARLKTRIQLAEAGQLNYLTNHPDSTKSNQIEYFFNPRSVGFVGSLPNIDRSISGHSYFTTSPEEKSIEIRRAVGKQVAKHSDLRFWMSEYCVLGDSLLKGEGRDLGMTTALFIAKLIHHDLTYANATSWQWWLAVSIGDYKDGLVYVDKSKLGGKVYDSKLLWGLGNYSRFISPGSTRQLVTMANEKNFYLSAYLKDQEVVAVAVNDSDQVVELQLTGIDQNRNAQLYTTSSNADLERSASAARNITLPAKSITTIIARREK
ncbi:MAG: xylanase [Flavobacterium sp.]|nr:MAG: xylanase [Flavobacterium sp.]